ncbi:MAG: glycosyltransferase [Candidatus Aminicenantes bacterium]
MEAHKKIHSVCFFGTYESTFPRTLTLKQACQRLKIKTLDCHIPFWEKKREKIEFFSLKSLPLIVFQLVFIYIRLMIRYLGLKDHDAVMVGYNGYFDVPLAKFLALLRRKPLIFTPVFPLYETSVEDREYIHKDSITAKIIHLIDEVGCRLADLIIIETQTYLDYYCREFKIRREKFFKIPLGADEKNFFSRPQEAQQNDSPNLRVLFYGKFIPLQGIPYIVEAAKLLEEEKDIKFEIIGSGQLSEDIAELAEELEVKNISFTDWVNYLDLPGRIQKADICLGIFGTTPKGRRGIPIKVYEALAMKKPVITGSSPAAREVFAHKINILLCEMGNSRALADSILLLKEDRKLREDIAQAGFELYQELFSSRRIAQEFKKALNRCIQ